MTSLYIHINRPFLYINVENTKNYISVLNFSLFLLNFAKFLNITNSFYFCDSDYKIRKKI